MNLAVNLRNRLLVKSLRHQERVELGLNCGILRVNSGEHVQDVACGIVLPGGVIELIGFAMSCVFVAWLLWFNKEKP